MDSKQTKPRTASATSPRVNRHDGRQRNLASALQCVYRERQTSRAHIARLTGLTRATVSELVAQLVEAGLVREAGPGISSGGKPPTLIELNAGGRDIVALDVSRQPFRGALVDLGGTLHDRAGAGPGHVRGAQGVTEVFSLVETLVRKARSPVLGIGVGTPGIVDSMGTVVEAANLGWHGVALQRDLATRFGVPVTVSNDAHVATLAEFGSRPGPNLVVVKIGVGIGCGIVVGGRLFRGDRPAAGEIGHIRVVEGGVLCTCGNSGCLETVASVPSVIRRAGAIAGVKVDPGDASTSDPDLGRIGDQAVGQAVGEAGRSIGAVLAHLVAILDIHRIVIALELPGWEEPLLEAIRQEVSVRVLPDLASVVEFASSRRGPDLVMAGAAALVLQEQLGVIWP